MKNKYGKATISIYEEDLKDVSAPDPRFKSVRVIGFVGETYRVPVNPGKRPRRKPGESPLDPPSE